MGRPKGDFVNRGTHSLNEDRSNANGEMRSKATVKRLKMYRNSKARRNAIGKIVKEAPFQSTLPSGKMARIEPNRKWFGNTRVISEKDLLKLQEYQTTYDPFQITLRKSLIPLSINMHKPKKNKPNFTTLQPYFKRKIPVKESNIKARSFEELAAQTKLYFESIHAKDSELQNDNEKDEATHGVFRAGTSTRIWMELYKVIDSSDVLLYVLDARNPMGLRSAKIENDIKNKQKTLIFVLNKVDLLPPSLARHWERVLNKEYPTVMFFADIKHPLGKMKLISLLRQLRNKMKDRRQISVGIIGFPNTGKSSLINTLKGEKVCKVAPIAGETKVWQYISLMKSINLIDCPGTVTVEKDEKVSETDLILKNTVRVERVEDPDIHIPAVLNIVNHDVIKKIYKINKPWKSCEEFLEMVAKKRGRLLKGGNPDIMSVSKEILKDFNCGKLLWYVKHTDYDDTKEEKLTDLENKNWLKDQIAIEQKEVAEMEKESKFENSITVGDESMVGDGDNDEEAESKDGDEMIEELEESGEQRNDCMDALRNENASGLERKKKGKKVQQKNIQPAKKMTSKERRRLERANKTKKVGYSFYENVDVKMRRTKF